MASKIDKEMFVSNLPGTSLDEITFKVLLHASVGTSYTLPRHDAPITRC